MLLVFLLGYAIVLKMFISSLTIPILQKILYEWIVHQLSILIMTKKKLCHFVATKSTMVLRPRTQTTGEEKVKENKIAASGIRSVDSENGDIVRKRKVTSDERKTGTDENIVKRVKAMNKNEMEMGPAIGSFRVLRSNSAKKGDESRKEVVKKESAEAKTKKQKENLSTKKEALLTIRSPKQKKNIPAAIGSTMVLRSRTLKAKREVPLKVDEKTKGKMPMELNEKKTVANGKTKIGIAAKIGTAGRRKFAADKSNTEVAGSRVKKLKAVINRNEMDKGAASESTRVLRSNRVKTQDESGKKYIKKGSAEVQTKKLKKNLLAKKEASLTTRSPTPKKNIPVRKKASSTIGSRKPKKNLPVEASKRIVRKGEKSEDPLSKEQGTDTIANNHRTVKRKKTTCVVTDSVLPPEIIMEILSWLPVKFFGSPMVVCKQWYALIQDRHFVEKHMSRNMNYIKAKVRQGYKEIYAYDGLKLEMNTSTRKYCIRNPDTKQFLELPDPHSSDHVIFFAYVPRTLNYKVVSIDDDKNSIECCDLSVENVELSWRLLKMPTKDYPKGKRKKFSVLVIGDVVHCFRVIASGDDMVEEVVSFDLGTEQFTVTNLPKGQYKSWEKVWLVEFKGKLALVDIIGTELCVLVLENYKTQKWGKKEPLVSLELLKKLEGEHGTTFPYVVDQYETLWFWLKKAKKCVSYNLKTKYICSKNAYKHSLVRLKGMQPE